MRSPICGRLDSYFDRLLPDEDQRRFERHLQDCRSCRHDVQRQRLIDRLLVEGNAQVEVPNGLLDQVERELSGRARRRVALMTLAAAASLFIASVVGWRLSQPAPTANRLVHNATEIDGDVPPHASPILDRDNQDATRTETVDIRPAVTVTSQRDVIVVPMATDSPGITIVWLYPTAHAAASSP